MTDPSIVFLLDVDDTLLDNDRYSADLAQAIVERFGVAEQQRWADIDKGLRAQYGFADYLGILQRFRLGLEDHPRILEMSDWLLSYPFDERVYPDTLTALAHLKSLGTPVVLSDGDAVFQPRKLKRAGLWDVLQGRVLIYVHKEAKLAQMQARYPADHYVMVDDKLRLLVAMKAELGTRLTTVFVRQGHYAADSDALLATNPPDIVIQDIGGLAAIDRGRFLSGRLSVT
ncbi:HAD family hydrolase [Pinirhizobacter sp.]|jgi:FMN phosphatase YigB (HAD superfamily)|uniref:HAD family hydrolase n=1 Tax=Pinirhizobacter sp. TaxID=2950432 RepID=UPI002F3E9D75